MHEELKARLLAWTKTSSSFGLDSIGKDIANALEAIEQLERQLAEHQSWFETVRNELDKTKVFANVQASAAAHWIEKHDAIKAQFAKYRDAPVVWIHSGELHQALNQPFLCRVLPEQCEGYKQLIVKPGE